MHFRATGPGICMIFKLMPGLDRGGKTVGEGGGDVETKVEMHFGTFKKGTRNLGGGLSFFPLFPIHLLFLPTFVNSLFVLFAYLGQLISCPFQIPSYVIYSSFVLCAYFYPRVFCPLYIGNLFVFCPLRKLLPHSFSLFTPTLSLLFVLNYFFLLPLFCPFNPSLFLFVLNASFSYPILSF